MFADCSRNEIKRTEGNQESTFNYLVNQLKLSRKSEAPTRAIVIIPDREGSTDIECVRRAGFLEIARVGANSTLFHTTSPHPGSIKTRLFPRKFSIFLFSNQISWLYDPVSWTTYVHAIESWGRDYAQGQVQIPMETGRKFQEVKMPDVKARLPTKLAETRQPPGPIVLLDGLSYHFEHNFLVYKGWDPRLVKRMIKINTGNKVAASIGLFHKPLLDEIKVANPLEYENNINRLSRTILLMSFQRYRKYQALRKRRQELEKILETNVLKCNDPFHHLPRTLMRGIESATCLCKQLMKGKKRKPLQSRGRPLASGRKHKKSKLPNLAGVSQTIPQIFERLNTGRTSDASMESRDRSLRFPHL